jgi:hypothetical protein
VREAFGANGPTVAFAFLLLFLPRLAAERSDRVKQARAVGPISALGFPLLAVRAEPSELVEGGAQYGFDGCLLYLGADDRHAVFFRREPKTESGMLVRLLSSKIVGLRSDVADSADGERCWAKPASAAGKPEASASLRARLRPSYRRARAGFKFRVRYTVSRAALVRITAWRGGHPVEQVVDSAETGRNRVDMKIDRCGTYALTLVAYGLGVGRVVQRARVVVQ